MKKIISIVMVMAFHFSMAQTESKYLCERDKNEVSSEIFMEADYRAQIFFSEEKMYEIKISFDGESTPKLLGGRYSNTSQRNIKGEWFDVYSFEFFDSEYFCPECKNNIVEANTLFNQFFSTDGGAIYFEVKLVGQVKRTEKWNCIRY
jgi:hypothetical protein